MSRPRVPTEDVLDAASDPQHPFHDLLDWDDAKLGKAHRLEQCREILREHGYVEQPDGRWKKPEN